MTAEAWATQHTEQQYRAAFCWHTEGEFRLTSGVAAILKRNYDMCSAKREYASSSFLQDHGDIGIAVTAAVEHEDDLPRGNALLISTSGSPL